MKRFENNLKSPENLSREYIILWLDWDLYRQSFADIIPMDNVQYIDRPLMGLSRFWQWLYSFIYSKHKNILLSCISKFLRLLIPRQIWYRYYFNGKKKKEEELVFIIARSWLLFHSEFIKYIKSKYKKSKFVVFFTDLFVQFVNGARRCQLDLQELKNTFDLILSFDQRDCEQFGFIYHPLVFSSYYGIIKDLPYSDIYFLGQPKNRFMYIIRCLEKFWAFGLKTDVHLIGVAAEDRIYEDRIFYHDNFVPYEDNLQHTIHCRCELEIMQLDGVGYTQRMCEAIALDKMIITNNPLIHEAPFYNPDYIFQINCADDITKEICDKIRNNTVVDYHYKEQISPIELLQFVDDKLMIS